MDAVSAQHPFPEWEANMQWVGSSPMRISEDLQGKVVVLYFWTDGCMRCIHMLSELAELEKKWASFPVALIGVHSPRFSHQAERENIEKAVLRFDISHPTVNDTEHCLKKKLGLKSGPYLVVLGTKANLLFITSGDERLNEVDQVVQAALSHYGLSRNENKHQDGVKGPIEKPFFPAQLTVDVFNRHLFISDPCRHRVVCIAEEGSVLYSIGSGEKGFQDGSFEEAQFHRPHGLIYADGKVYVADTYNHAIRCIDLHARMVSTIADTGKRGTDYRDGMKGIRQAFRYPWDLTVKDERMFLAMAGGHQIWSYSFKTGNAQVYCGSGEEGDRSCDHLLQVSLAQPSGISWGGSELYIADTGNGAIRSIDLEKKWVRTLGGNDSKRLQHPLAVLWVEELRKAVIADTCNHQLKWLDPKTQILEDWVGSGNAGHSDGFGKEAAFNEPSGLALSSDRNRLFVADTNNHCIREVVLQTGEVRTVTIGGVL